MTTFRASLTRMARIDFGDLHTTLSGFLSKKRVKLSKRPAMKPSFGLNVLALFSASNLACAADMGQILNHESTARGGILNDSSTKYVVTVPVKTSLFSSQFLEMMFCRLASFGLKLTLEAKIPTVNLFPATVAKKLTSARNSRTVQAKVYPDNLITLGNIRLRDRDHNMQPVPTIADAQISSSYRSTRIFSTV